MRSGNFGKVASKLTEDDYYLVDSKNFAASNKLTLSWKEPQLMLQSLLDYVFQVEGLRSWTHENVHDPQI